MSHVEQSNARAANARTDDDNLFRRNRDLIAQAQAAVEDRHRQRMADTERSDRTHARGMLMHRQGRDMATRLTKIREGTEERCRRSRRASDLSEAMLGHRVLIVD